MRIPIRPIIIKIIITLILLDGIFLSQLSYDSWKMAYAQKPDQPENVLIEPHPVPPKTLKKVSFGMNSLISDIMWLQTIQYYGSGNPQGKYRRLADMLEGVTEMDERFSYPYVFALLVLPGEGFTKEAAAIGEQAMKNPKLNDNWEIPYYLGLIYHINLKDHARAAKLFTEAANRPGALEISRILAANYYANANKREIALDLYYVSYKTSKSPYIRDKAKNNIGHLQLMFSLEDAAKKFKKTFKRYPTNLQELVDKHIIKNIAPDPLDQTLTINPKTGVVTGIVKK